MRKMINTYDMLYKIKKVYFLLSFNLLLLSCEQYVSQEDNRISSKEGESLIDSLYALEELDTLYIKYGYEAPEELYTFLAYELKGEKTTFCRSTELNEQYIGIEFLLKDSVINQVETVSGSDLFADSTLIKKIQGDKVDFSFTENLWFRFRVDLNKLCSRLK